MPFRDVDANLRSTLSLLASRQPAGETRELEGLTLACAGVRFSMFNAALVAAPVTRSQGGLEPRIASAAQVFTEKRLDWSCWVCEHWLEAGIRRGIGHFFERYGMIQATAYPGMLAQKIRPPERRLPVLEIRRAGDAATRAAFCDIGCVCFHLPASWFREMFDREAVWAPGFAGYVGYLDGEPVATAAATVAAGAVGIYNVATLPAFQRQGYAEVVVRHALAEARRETGLERTVLQSSAQGFGLYARMGYETVTRFVIYVTR